MAHDITDLALAYELRQEGCSWKRIAQGVGGDWLALKNAVEGVMRHGIAKHLSGYAVQSGRRPVFTMEQIRLAHAQRAAGRSWIATAAALGVDPERLRRAHRYALNAKLID